MKKFFPFLISILFIPAVFLSSCSKSDSLQQVADKQTQDNPADEAKHNHHGGGCCSCCPSIVPEATEISYYLNSYDAPLHIGLYVDVSYSNPEAAGGTFRVALEKATGGWDTTTVVPAAVFPAGQTGVFHLVYDLPYEAFPCTVHVIGRPADYHQCHGRTRKTFDIELNVSK